MEISPDFGTLFAAAAAIGAAAAILVHRVRFSSDNQSEAEETDKANETDFPSPTVSQPKES